MIERVAHEAAQGILADGREEEVPPLLEQRVHRTREAVDEHPDADRKDGAAA